MPTGGMALKAYEKGDSECQCEKVVALMPKLEKWLLTPD